MPPPPPTRGHATDRRHDAQGRGHEAQDARHNDARRNDGRRDIPASRAAQNDRARRRADQAGQSGQGGRGDARNRGNARKGTRHASREDRARSIARTRRLTVFGMLAVGIVVLSLLVALSVAQTNRAVLRHASYGAEQAVADTMPAESGAADASSADASASSTDASASADATSTDAPSSDASATTAQAIDWQGASGGAYPDMSQYDSDNLSVQVSLAEQRVYIKNGNDTIYTMICSSGMDDTTPTGTYYIQSRGESFYNPNEQMGANYWVSFYGDYLFHTVPTDVNGEYIVSEAEKLGQPASHGCVRLTVSDAQWFYANIPDGTRIDIA